MVHVRVTTVGHVPTATSIYVTEVIAQLSDATPWLVPSSNTVSLEEVEVVEYAGPVIAAVLQPSIFRVTAQVVIVGCVISTTLTTWVQIKGEQPEHVTELWIV